MNRYFIYGVGSLMLLLLCSFAWQKKKLTVWMMGDSTMAIKAENKYPETGWGVPFATLFNEHVQVNNTAKNGRSTKSFIREGLWDGVQQGLQKGDYLLIQFGHNDEKVDKPNVGVTVDEYKANLALFVQAARAKEAIPILLTPIARRSFVQGKPANTHKAYAEGMMELADSLDVALIDLTQLTGAMLAEKGEAESMAYFLHLPEGSTNYPQGVKDNTHLNVEGADAVARLVAEALSKQHIPLAKELKK
ncbi:rhamnogalacturonan acetylesterase [Sphingobacterium bambusae]|uniref:Rhamnogalacturonan acetylesterase n=1 Tax=Sphingobacterium bambusae TaxID=662858 RepID=A0ABW6BK55_9SPHI|nr:rhamnogalacturonan acetylesterase [Sphingobacterium bambusae]WPL46689.1 rhamnogalacturonan acetylesterase [Sphingobacterium bambusae]